MNFFGTLSIDSFVQTSAVAMGAQVFVIVAATGGVLWLIFSGTLDWLWREWLTSLDHKRIGVMYLILAGIMGVRGLADATLLRTQQATAALPSSGYLSAEHFAEIFSAHGVIMIFFVAMPLIFGLINLVIPLQIRSRDVAFPFLNSLSLWLTVAGALLVNASLVVGQFSAAGWLPYPPLSELAFSPGVGVDYYIWALQIAGVASLISAINFLTTIITMRTHGMRLMHMPMFTWTTLGSMLLVLFAFPLLTVVLALLFFDRALGMHFFTSTLGGNPMMFVNLIWAWGHPEVYILVLPLFGVFSEVVPTFSHKKLFGYTSMVVATMAITALSFLVWVHHFFTMGAGANVNAVFGIATMAIAIPTGVKIFNWLFTMFRGRIVFKTPMLWFMGFVSTFVIGGMTGVLLSIPGADYQLHNSVFLVAHFHNMIIGGVVFGFFAGFTYWFPKFAGFTLDERLGKWAFWLWVTGFLVAFMPLYALGLMGMTRRLYVVDPSWQPLLIVAAVGLAIILAAVAVQIAQLVVSVRNRERLHAGHNPWGSHAPEWAPLPPVDRTHNTGVAMCIGALAFLGGFGMVWHMWWLAILALAVSAVLFILPPFKHV
ncbi:MAG: cbb3-type cytochrome c oxidase subunit I [Patescibacteria group bacterium]|nr:cbb3-type cytochrome c oxidase subunit I [Patescibacteria group bacterium]